MSNQRRLLEASVAMKDPIPHGADETDCEACRRFDELQSAAMAVIGELEDYARATPPEPPR